MSMKLKLYLQNCSKEERTAFAERAGTVVAYLYQIAGGHRKASAQMAIQIEEASNGAVPRHELRPDFWKAPRSVA